MAKPSFILEAKVNPTVVPGVPGGTLIAGQEGIVSVKLVTSTGTWNGTNEADIGLSIEVLSDAGFMTNTELANSVTYQDVTSTVDISFTPTTPSKVLTLMKLKVTVLEGGEFITIPLNSVVLDQSADKTALDIKMDIDSWASKKISVCSFDYEVNTGGIDILTGEYSVTLTSSSRDVSIIDVNTATELPAIETDAIVSIAVTDKNGLIVAGCLYQDPDLPPLATSTVSTVISGLLSAELTYSTNLSVANIYHDRGERSSSNSYFLKVRLRDANGAVLTEGMYEDRFIIDATQVVDPDTKNVNGFLVPQIFHDSEGTPSIKHKVGVGVAATRREYGSVSILDKVTKERMLLGDLFCYVVSGNDVVGNFRVSPTVPVVGLPVTLSFDLLGQYSTDTNELPVSWHVNDQLLVPNDVDYTIVENTVAPQVKSIYIKSCPEVLNVTADFTDAPLSRNQIILTKNFYPRNALAAITDMSDVKLRFNKGAHRASFSTFEPNLNLLDMLSTTIREHSLGSAVLIPNTLMVAELDLSKHTATLDGLYQGTLNFSNDMIGSLNRPVSLFIHSDVEVVEGVEVTYTIPEVDAASNPEYPYVITWEQYEGEDLVSTWDTSVNNTKATLAVGNGKLKAIFKGEGVKYVDPFRNSGEEVHFNEYILESWVKPVSGKHLNLDFKFMGVASKLSLYYMPELHSTSLDVKQCTYEMSFDVSKYNSLLEIPPYTTPIVTVIEGDFKVNKSVPMTYTYPETSINARPTAVNFVIKDKDGVVVYDSSSFYWHLCNVYTNSPTVTYPGITKEALIAYDVEKDYEIPISLTWPLFSNKALFNYKFSNVWFSGDLETFSCNTIGASNNVIISREKSKELFLVDNAAAQAAFGNGNVINRQPFPDVTVSNIEAWGYLEATPHESLIDRMTTVNNLVIDTPINLTIRTSLTDLTKVVTGGMTSLNSEELFSVKDTPYAVVLDSVSAYARYIDAGALIYFRIHGTNELRGGIVRDDIVISNKSWDKPSRFKGEPLTWSADVSSPSGMKLDYVINVNGSYFKTEEGKRNLPPKAFLEKPDMFAIPLTTPTDPSNSTIGSSDFTIEASNHSLSLSTNITQISAAAKRVSDSPVFKFETLLLEGVKSIRVCALRADYTTEDFFTITASTGTYSGLLRDEGDLYFREFTFQDDAFYDLMTATDGGVGESIQVDVVSLGTSVVELVTQTDSSGEYLGYSTGGEFYLTEPRDVNRSKFGYLSSSLFTTELSTISKDSYIQSFLVPAITDNVIIIEWDYNFIDYVGKVCTLTVGGNTPITATLIADGERVVANFDNASELVTSLRASKGNAQGIDISVDKATPVVYGDTLFTFSTTLPVDSTLSSNGLEATIFFNDSVTEGPLVGSNVTTIVGDILPKIRTMGITKEGIPRPFIIADNVLSGGTLTLTSDWSSFNTERAQGKLGISGSMVFTIDNTGVGFVKTSTPGWDAWWARASSPLSSEFSELTGINVVFAERPPFEGNSVMTVGTNANLQATGFRANSSGSFGSVDRIVEGKGDVFTKLSNSALVEPTLVGLYAIADDSVKIEFDHFNPRLLGRTLTYTDSDGSYEAIITEEPISIPAPSGYLLNGIVPGSNYSFNWDSSGVGNSEDVNFIAELYHYRGTDLMTTEQLVSNELSNLFTGTTQTTFTPYPSVENPYFGFKFATPVTTMQIWEISIEGVKQGTGLVEPGGTELKVNISSERFARYLAEKPEYAYFNLTKIIESDNAIVPESKVTGSVTTTGYSTTLAIGSVSLDTMRINGNFDTNVPVLGLYVEVDSSTTTSRCFMELGVLGTDAVGRTMTISNNSGDTVTGIVTEGNLNDGILIAELIGTDTKFVDSLVSGVGSLFSFNYSLSDSVITDGSNLLVAFKDMPVPSGNTTLSIVDSITHSILPADGDSSWFLDIKYLAKADGSDSLEFQVVHTSVVGSMVNISITDVADDEAIELVSFNVTVESTKVCKVTKDMKFYSGGKVLGGAKIIEVFKSLLGNIATFDVTIVEPVNTLATHNVTLGFNKDITRFGFSEGDYGKLDKPSVLGSSDRYNEDGTTDLLVKKVEVIPATSLTVGLSATAVEQIGRTLTFKRADSDLVYTAVLDYNKSSGLIEAVFGKDLADVYDSVYSGYKLGFDLSISGETTTTYFGNYLARTSSKVVVGKHIARTGTNNAEGDFIVGDNSK